MATINFTCPHCQSQMNFPSTAVGQQGKCSGCLQNVTIQPDLRPPLPNPTAKRKIIIFAAVAASAFGVVILCISGSLLVYFSQQEGISIHIPQQEGTSIPISQKEGISIPLNSGKEDLRPSNITEEMFRAFVMAESSEPQALAVMQKYMVGPEDATKGARNATLEEFRASLKNYQNQYIERWIKIISREKMGVTLDTTIVQWSEMKILATIDNFSEVLIDPNDDTEFSSVTFLSKGNEYFYIFCNEIFVHASLREKFFVGDQVSTGSVKQIHMGWATNRSSHWPVNLTDRLRALNDKELTFLIYLLEKKGFE